MIWRIRRLINWLWEYITLTPKKYDEVVYKLECLLCHATGGAFSKSSYSLGAMYSMVNDHVEQCCTEAVEEAITEKEEKDVPRGMEE